MYSKSQVYFRGGIEITSKALKGLLKVFNIYIYIFFIILFFIISDPNRYTPHVTNRYTTTTFSSIFLDNLD